MKKIEDDEFLELMTVETEVRVVCKEPYRSDHNSYYISHSFWSLLGMSKLITSIILSDLIICFKYCFVIWHKKYKDIIQRDFKVAWNMTTYHSCNPCNEMMLLSSLVCHALSAKS